MVVLGQLWGVPRVCGETYQAQAGFVQEEILKVQQDLEWLSLKIRQRENQGRFVPPRLYDSLAFKKSKIKALKKLKKEYEQRSEEHEKKKALNPRAAGHPGLEATVKKKMTASGLGSWLEILPHRTAFCLENRLPILFASGSAVIPKGYLPFLKKLAHLIKGYDVRVLIDGYADQDPIHTPRYPSNFELGAARATAVVHALVKYGIKPSVFKISSTGEYRFDAQKARQWKDLKRHVNIMVLFTGQGGTHSPSPGATRSSAAL
jgi:chemotaxis protein MotB